MRRFQLLERLLVLGAFALCATACAKKEGAGGGGGGEAKEAPKGKPYVLTVDPPRAVAAGQESVASIKVVPKSGYKVNLEFPTKLTVGCADGTDPKTRTMGAKDAAELTAKELLMKPGFALKNSGSLKCQGQLNFSVCTEQLCEIKNEPVGWVATAR